MKNFSRDRSSGGSRFGGGGGSRFGGRDSGGSRGGFGGGGKRFGGGRPSFGEKQMYTAVCDECRNECEVPFKPTGERPVYCSNCFRSKGDSDSRFGGRDSERSERRPSFDRSDFGEKRMHHAVCDECGEDCEVPFKPTGEKPVYCSNCFGKGGSSSGGGKGGANTQELKEQFEMLSSKLDRIIKLLGANNTLKILPMEEKKDFNKKPEMADMKRKPGMLERKPEVAEPKKIVPVAPVKKMEAPKPKMDAKKVASPKAAPKKAVTKNPVAKKAAPKKKK